MLHVHVFKKNALINCIWLPFISFNKNVWVHQTLYNETRVSYKKIRVFAVQYLRSLLGKVRQGGRYCILLTLALAYYLVSQLIVAASCDPPFYLYRLKRTIVPFRVIEIVLV